MEDSKIIELFFERSEQAIAELSYKYGGVCRKIEKFLDTLDRKSRVMFIKRYWYAESVKAIAGELGMAENSVSVKLLRIREKLKRHLEKEGIVL